MSTYQDLLDDLALVIGGTAKTGYAGFYSGATAGDGTGVSGLKGCYSRAPENIEEPPVGILLPVSFREQIPGEGSPTGHRIQRDVVRLLLMVRKVDMPTDMAALMPFRDLVVAAFDTHMTAQPAGATVLSPVPLQAHVTRGSAGTITWAGESYYGWTFDIEALRFPVVTFGTS